MSQAWDPTLTIYGFMEIVLSCMEFPWWYHRMEIDGRNCSWRWLILCEPMIRRCLYEHKGDGTSTKTIAAMLLELFVILTRFLGGISIRNLPTFFLQKGPNFQSKTFCFVFHFFWFFLFILFLRALIIDFAWVCLAMLSVTCFLLGLPGWRALHPLMQIRPDNLGLNRTERSTASQPASGKERKAEREERKRDRKSRESRTSWLKRTKQAKMEIEQEPFSAVL